ncbi:High-affinity nickel transport protein [Nostocoides japonicum T1-X7]|uniref:Nickel/cobalt efflux system n=1 Tax=Nostocoides japonicum T1-X7 TaxID=1194083 RepID=A0A077LZZ4_9MICO|nr:HoxN/HupN/NixA family nickel/cobalt transporter [Tetrasphaera japonica]CCH79578.1 High-affinity nickel transport protein [Tetrasphaera japonica T1-X7]
MTAHFGRPQWIAIGLMTAAVLALHVVGFALLVGVVAPQHYVLGSQAFGIGLGLTAYTLGMRHAFDADHIAAIDNTTRKLMEDGQKPVTVGFWFSLGHSTVVFAMCTLLALGIRSLVGQVESDDSTLHTVTGVWGPTVSGLFLIALGLVNLATLLGIVKVFRRMRRGTVDEAELEETLANKGALYRMFGGLTRIVRRPWHIYPVGVLFGFGFDTATEVSLLILAGGAAAVQLPWYAILTLPLLFTAGMSLLDSFDGAFMNAAYGWAFARPVRKIYYNMTVTALSVTVALVIGGIELISVLAARLDITTGPLAAIGNIGLDYVGYAIVALFILTWALAVGVWRWGRVEQRWESALATAPETGRAHR